MNQCLIPEPLVFCDLETTGANFANDRILEIGLIQVDADGVREWSSLVNPDATVSTFITGLTGIDTAMVTDAPRFEKLAQQVADKLRGRLFIAHNARFDYGFLKQEFRRLGIDFRSPTLCTVKLSRKLFPEHHRHNLDTLVDRYGINVSERHRALADARVLWDLWQRWHELLPSENIHKVVTSIVGRPVLPPQLDSALIDDLPEAPGAYALYSHDGTLLQAKRSTNIRSQVLSLFVPGRHDTALARNTCGVDWREAAGELGARLHEIALSGTGRKHSDDLCSWRLVQHADGDYRTEIVFSRDIDLAVTEDVFGLYMNRREAVQAMRKLADAQRLCYSQLGLGDATQGTPCIAHKQKTCRGTCIGKEARSLHSARLMAALSKFKLKPWPYSGPVGMLECDEFGMRTDFHLVDRWRYLGTVQNEHSLTELLDKENHSLPPFDQDIYRIINKFLQTGKIRVIPVPSLL